MKFNRVANNFSDEVNSGAIHSSGMAQEVPSGEHSQRLSGLRSFTRRRQVDRNRQTIRGYGDAGVRVEYKRDAQQITGSSLKSTEVSIDDPTSNRMLTRASKLEKTNNTRQGFNANSGADTKPIIAKPEQPSFREPSSRRYNPYL